jgi:hypothetical protein
MATPGLVLSQKALVGISPAFGNAGLASSPNLERPGAAVGTIAFTARRLALRDRVGDASIVTIAGVGRALCHG